MYLKVIYYLFSQRKIFKTSFFCIIIIIFLPPLLSSSSPPSSPLCPCPQGVVPAAEPAHGRSAGVHLRRAAGPQPRRCLDGPGHAVRVLQPAARRHQVLHQCHSQQGLHQHCCANPPHQMPAGGWREGFHRRSNHAKAVWMGI